MQIDQAQISYDNLIPKLSKSFISFMTKELVQTDVLYYQLCKFRVVGAYEYYSNASKKLTFLKKKLENLKTATKRLQETYRSQFDALSIEKVKRLIFDICESKLSSTINSDSISSDNKILSDDYWHKEIQKAMDNDQILTTIADEKALFLFDDEKMRSKFKLYYIWKKQLRRSENKVLVNVLMSMASSDHIVSCDNSKKVLVLTLNTLLDQMLDRRCSLIDFEVAKLDSLIVKCSNFLNQAEIQLKAISFVKNKIHNITHSHCVSTNITLLVILIVINHLLIFKNVTNPKRLDSWLQSLEAMEHKLLANTVFNVLVLFIANILYKSICKISHFRQRYDNGIIILTCVGYIILNTFKIPLLSLLFDDFSFLELNTELCLIYFYICLSKIFTLNIKYLMHIFKFQNQILLSDQKLLVQRLLSKMFGVLACFAVNCFVILQLRYFSIYKSLSLFDLALPVH